MNFEVMYLPTTVCVKHTYKGKLRKRRGQRLRRFVRVPGRLAIRVFDLSEYLFRLTGERCNG